VARTSTTQVQARERARARLADKHAAARAREKATEDDLVAFFALDADHDTAAQTRDAAIAAATAAFDTAVAATRAAQQEKVRAILDRGESVADVVELTGWPAKAVRAALKARADDPPSDISAAATSGAAESDQQAS